MFDYDILKGVKPITHISLTRHKDKVNGTARVTYAVGSKVYSVATIFNYTVGNMNSFDYSYWSNIEGTTFEVTKEDYHRYWYPDFTILGE